MILVGVGETVAIEIVERGGGGRGGIGAVHETVAIGVARERIESGGDLRAIRDAVAIRVHAFRIGAIQKELIGGGESVVVIIACGSSVWRQVIPDQCACWHEPSEIRERFAEAVIPCADGEDRYFGDI